MLRTFVRHGSNGALVLAVVVLAVLLGAGVLVFAPLALLAGAATFFVSEYTTHRFVLHAKPVAHPFVLRLQQRLHYDHHRVPDRLDLLFLPLWFVIPVVGAFAAIAWLVTRSAGGTASATLGALAAMLWYEWVHYVAHIPFVPRTAVGRWIKKHHLRHHFLSERHWFGVTSPVMDVLGRTMRASDEVERSATTRVLYPR